MNVNLDLFHGRFSGKRVLDDAEWVNSSDLPPLVELALLGDRSARITRRTGQTEGLGATEVNSLPHLASLGVLSLLLGYSGGGG